MAGQTGAGVGSGRSRPSRWGSGSAPPGAVVPVALSLVSLRFNDAYPKQDFEGARRFVEGARVGRGGDRHRRCDRVPYRDYFNLEWPSVDTRVELTRLRAESPRIWAVYTFPRYLERSAPEIMAVITRDCPTTRVFPGTVGGGDIIVCAIPPHTAPTMTGTAR